MLDVFRTLHTVLGDIEGADAVREAIVFAAWRRIAGESLSEHTVPLKLVNGTLSVAVASVTWQRHLKDLCAQMVFKLNAALGSPTVNFIQLRIDEQAIFEERKKRSHSSHSNEADAAEEISPELATAANTIVDEDLRRQFLLAVGKCLMRRERIAQRTPSAAPTPAGLPPLLRKEGS